MVPLCLVEDDIHLRPLNTSILDIHKVFEALVCCLKGIWVHPYTIPLANMAPDLGYLGCLWSGNDAIMSWLRLEAAILNSNCFLHPYKIYTKRLSHWNAVTLWLYCVVELSPQVICING